MSWLKHPAKAKKKQALVYQAQFINNQLDQNNPMIQQIINEMGDIAQTLPNLQLSELKELTERLQQDVAIATGEVVQLGDITYLTPDVNNPKRLIETGLTWENATVKAGMENFVIETVNQVLNDETTRLDDDISYPELADALSEFLTANHEFAGFDKRELPELPTADAYITAVENNQQFKLLSQRLVISDVSENEPVKQLVSSEPASSESATMAETTDDLNSEVTNTVASSQVSEPVNDMTEKVPVVSSPVSPANSQGNKQVTENSTLTIANLIKEFQVQPTFFTMKLIDVNQAVVPESDHYVDVMMAREAQEANTFIQQAADKVVDSYRENLTQNVADVQEDTKLLNDLLTTDWQTPVKEQIKQRHSKDYGEQLDKSIQALQNDYEQAVTEEEQRHEQTLAKLSKQLTTNKDKATSKFTADRDQIIQNEIAQIITTQKQYIEQEIQQLRYNRAEFKRHKVIDQIISSQKEANELLTKHYRSLSSSLEVRRQDFIKEHEQALVMRQDSDEAQAEKERLKLENANVLNLEERRDHLESVKLDLEGKIGQLQADSSKWQFRAETAQEDLDRAKQQIKELNHQYEQRLKSDQIDLKKQQQLFQQARQARLARWLHPIQFRQQSSDKKTSQQ